PCLSPRPPRRPSCPYTTLFRSSTSAMTGVINDRGVWFFLDTHVQVDPTAEQIAEATIQGAYRLKLFGIEPRVALLSHSNFGSHEDRKSTRLNSSHVKISYAVFC